MAKAEAGSPDDLAMILTAVRATAGGASDLNARAMAQMRGWVRGVVACMVAARRDPADGSVLLAKLGSVMQLATVLMRLGEVGDRAEARRLYEEVVAGQTAQLGPAHANTLLTKGNLASLLDKMGEWAEARRVYEEVAAGQTVQLGPAHTSTLITKMNLAVLLKQAGDLASAKPLYEEAAAGFTAQLGPEHPHTKIAVKNLATCLRQLGAPAPAAVAVLEPEPESGGGGRGVVAGMVAARAVAWPRAVCCRTLPSALSCE